MKRHLVLLFCLLQPAGLEAQTPDPKPKTSCTVQGKAVQEPGGMPLRKVDIALVSVGDDAEGRPDRTAVSDAEGNFRIEGVAPGTYRAWAGHSGFVETDKHHSGVLVSVIPGQEFRDLVLRLQAAAAITGKIMDQDGDPMPDAEVMAIPYTRNLRVPVFGWRARGRLSSSSSNDIGEFRVGDLSPGRYFVVAHPPIREMEPLKAGTADESIYTTTYYPGTFDKSHAAPLELHAGDEVPLKLSLAVTRAFHVRGKVMSFSACEGADSRVILRPKDANGLREKEFWLGKDGAFDISGVLPGSYVVFVLTTGGQGSEENRGTEIVEVTDSDIDDLRIATVASSQVRGQFRMDNGRKVDWSGTMVGLESDEDAGQDLSMSPLPSQLKSDGSFEISDVVAGNYHMRVRSPIPTLRDYFIEAMNVGGKDAGDSGLTVDGAAYSVDVVVSANGATVEGVVLGDDKQPIPRVDVVCIPGANLRKGLDLHQQTFTDKKGHFSLRGLNPGEYTIFALDDYTDDITNPEFVSEHEGSGQTVKVNEGEHKSIVLKLAPPENGQL